jgi:hypothetical protein
MRYAEFISGIRTAYEHRGGLKMFACGQVEDSWFKQICSEVNWILDSQSASDVTSKDHVTNWTRPTGEARQFSLFNRTGKTDDFMSDHSFDRSTKRLTFPHLNGIQRFAKLFGPNLLNLRLNGLGKSSGLGAHEERSIQSTARGLMYKIRFHLPIYTNPDARICLDGEMFHFEPGVLYFFNQGCVHAAINIGDAPRYHFVLDCLLTRKLHTNLLSQKGKPVDDRGFRTLNAFEAKGYNKSEPWSPADFTTEAGTLRTRLDYGRVAPELLDFLRGQRPNLFARFDQFLGRNPRKVGL